MLRVLVFLVVVALAAVVFGWIIDRPGDLVVTWPGYRAEPPLGVALAILLGGALVLVVAGVLLQLLLRLPQRIRQHAAAQRQAKGHAALSRGMIAVGAGDARLARQSAAEAGRHLINEPLMHLLSAQAAQLSGDRGAAIAAFEKLAAMPATRLLGLRGLHVEAQRRGDQDAALHYAHEAHKIAPLPWSAKAVLEHRAAHAQWAGALAALDSHIAAKLVDKPTGERQRAVLQTAIALDKVDRAPEEALHLARQALAHAPDLVPAVVLAARILSRKGEVRKGAKLIESAWARQRHPELAEAYIDLRPGDSNADRLAKAQVLAKLAPRDSESAMIVARAALAARDYTTARQAMAPLVGEGEQPSVRACLIMAELEDAEFGNQGQVREWLARSARAPRDPAWIADGVASKHWAPVSPVTGRLDAFIWQKPMERLGTHLGADLDAADWTKHWALPGSSPAAPMAMIEATALEARALAAPENPAPMAEIETKPVSPVAALVDPEPSAQTALESMSALAKGTIAANLVTKPAAAPRGVQKVVFPLPGAPDDPGPEEPPEPAVIHRMGY
jgi:HemY protein